MTTAPEAREVLPPSPGTPGEASGIGDCPLSGRGGGSPAIRNPQSKIRNQSDPHPNPPPEYRERGQGGTPPRGLHIIVTLAVLLSGAATAAADDDLRPIFDGTSLAGWSAPDPSYWSVEDGAITGRITKEHPLDVNQYLVWQGGPGADGGRLGDFELKLKSRLRGEGGINNGFQFRSRVLPDGDDTGR